MGEKEEIHDTMRQIRTSSAVLIVLVIALAVLFLVVLLGNGTSSSNTFDDLYQQTLYGDETEFNFLYNGYVFIYDGTFWIVRVAKSVEGTDVYTEFNIPFYYNPRQVENISYELGARNVLLNKDIIYLTQDQNSSAELSLAAIEVGRILGQRYGILNIETRAAVTSDAPANYPEITCANATRESGVIYFKVGEEDRIYTQGECLIVEGTSPQDVLRASSKLAFVLLNIVEDPTPTQRLPPLETLIIGPYQIDIYGVVARSEVEGGVHQGFIMKDVAQGQFYIPVTDITNLGNTSVTFTPVVFSLTVGNETRSINYQKQRFLNNKLELTNTIQPGEVRPLNMLWDMEPGYDEVTLSVRFLGYPSYDVVLPVVQ